MVIAKKNQECLRWDPTSIRTLGTKEMNKVWTLVNINLSILFN